ncbi:TIGR03943 family putative permease subunit [Corynebacterium diphtheriae]|uniref:TIGR03943 family putative permease subunit n=1 Tax=Corynebacterium diphtheriae TaxID=1717 RepID=UPI000A6541E6
MKQTAQTHVFIVGALGIAMTYLALTGRINNYLQPGFRPASLATGLVLVALALWSAVRPNSFSSRRTSWFLLVPVCVVAVFAPAALGAATLNSSGVTRVVGNNLDDLALPKLAKDQLNPMTMEELITRFLRSDSATFDGTVVEVEGFASAAADGTWRLSRYKIYCCAADAMAYTATLETSTSMSSDQWYRVRGVVRVSSAHNPQFPVIEVHNLEAIDTPTEPYL